MQRCLLQVFNNAQFSIVVNLKFNVRRFETKSGRRVMPTRYVPTHL